MGPTADFGASNPARIDRIASSDSRATAQNEGRIFVDDDRGAEESRALLAGTGSRSRSLETELALDEIVDRFRVGLAA